MLPRVHTGLRAVRVASVSAAAYFVALKTVPAWGALHMTVIAGIAGSAAEVIRDPTDLVCLISTALAYAYLRRSTSAHASRVGSFVRHGGGA